MLINPWKVIWSNQKQSRKTGEFSCCFFSLLFLLFFIFEKSQKQPWASSKKVSMQPDLVMQACNPNYSRTDTIGSESQNRIRLRSKIKVSLDNLARVCFKIRKIKGTLHWLCSWVGEYLLNMNNALVSISSTSINQSINQSANQSTSQSIKQLFTHSAGVMTSSADG